MTTAKGSIEIPYAIGSRMWWTGPAYKTVWETCPDCAGQKAVTMILGNGEQHTLECGNCGLGFNPPRGVVERTIPGYEVLEVELKSAQMYGGEVYYTISHSGGSVSPDDLWENREACAEACEIKRAEQQKQRDEQAMNCSASKRRSMAHSVSYWRSQVKRYREELERAERRLNVAKERAEAKGKAVSA